MAVLVEAFSVIVRIDIVKTKLAGGWPAFLRLVPNETLCDDGTLARVGFMHADDMGEFINRLEKFGLVFRRDETALDFAVVDQSRGPTLTVPWLTVGRKQVGDGEVAAAWLHGRDSGSIALPEGWKFAGSISQQAIHSADPEKGGKPRLGRQDSTDLHVDLATGKPLYVGRTTNSSREDRVFDRLKAICRETLDLAAQADNVRSANDEAGAIRIFRRLQDGLLPEAESVRAGSGRNLAIAHYSVGLLLRVLDRYEEALPPLLRARELQPEVSNTLLELVLCLGRLGRNAEAIPYARESVLLKPDSPETLGNLAMCLLQVGEREEARQVLDRALERDPTNRLNIYMDEHFHQYQ